MYRQLGASLILLAVVLSPAGAAVDRYLVANEALTQPRLRKFFNGPLLVTAQTVGANGKEELFIALSLQPQGAWEVTRLPLPPGQRRGDRFDAVVLTPSKPLRVLYAGAVGSPQQVVPVWRWVGAGPWQSGRDPGPENGAQNRIINSVAVGDEVGKVVYAAGCEVLPPTGRSVAQVWQSQDSGQTWRRLCQNGAPLPAAPTGGAVYLGPQPVGRPTVVGSVADLSRGQPAEASLDATVLGLNSGAAIWGRVGDRVLRIERGRLTFLDPHLTNCVSFRRVSAPLPLAVWAYWWKDAMFAPRRYLTWSEDNGEHWGFQPLDPSNGAGAWAIPIAGECLVDFRDMKSGCVAAQVSDGAGGKLWTLYYRTSKQSRTDPWRVEKLTGYNIVDLQATWDGEACMLARTWDPNTLYCLHWQAVRPKVNHPPSQPTTITFSPPQPTTNDNVRCTARGSVDPDSDKVTYTYQWQKYGGGAINPALKTNVLAAKWTKPGEHWVVVVTPTDGKLTGIPAVGQVDIAP